MLMRTALWRRAHPVHVLAAAILTLAALAGVQAAASAEAQPAGLSGAPTTVALAEGLPGGGMPPSPGPTDPSDPAD